MTTKQITGVGPKKADGSVDLFTIDARPINVTAAWLEAQTSYPATGDELSFDKPEGPYVLVASGSAPVSAEPKKEDGLDAHTPPSKPSSLTISTGVQLPKALPMYTTKPSRVQAGQITEVGDKDVDGKTIVTLEDGTTRLVSNLSICGIGDYWCTDGSYEWTMPASMFAEKFQAA